MLMKIVLIVLCVLMSLFGLAFLVLFITKRKKINKEDEKQVRNQKLNLILTLVFLAGAILTITFLPFVF